MYSCGGVVCLMMNTPQFSSFVFHLIATRGFLLFVRVRGYVSLRLSDPSGQQRLQRIVDLYLSGVLP